MPEYNGNNVYLTINAVDVKARWRSMEMKQETGDEDVSAGANVAWEKHASKLKKITATVTLIYDDATAAADMAALVTATDVVAIVHGPEGNTAGKPKHDQDFLMTSVDGPKTNHDKTLVTLVYECVSTGVPRSNFYAGATF